MFELLYGAPNQTTYVTAYANRAAEYLTADLEKCYLDRLHPDRGFRAVLWENRTLGGKIYSVLLQTGRHSVARDNLNFCHVIGEETSEAVFAGMLNTILRPHGITEEIFLDAARKKASLGWDPFEDAQQASTAVDLTGCDAPLSPDQLAALLLEILRRPKGKKLILINRENDPVAYEERCFAILRQVFARLPVSLRSNLGFSTYARTLDETATLSFCRPEYEGVFQQEHLLDIDRLTRPAETENDARFAVFLANADENQLQSFFAYLRRSAEFDPSLLLNGNDCVKLYSNLRKMKDQDSAVLLSSVFSDYRKAEVGLDTVSAVYTLQTRHIGEAVQAYFQTLSEGACPKLTEILTDWRTADLVSKEWDPTSMAILLASAFKDAAAKLTDARSPEASTDGLEKALIMIRSLPHSDKLPQREITEAFLNRCLEADNENDSANKVLTVWKFLNTNQTIQSIDGFDDVRTAFQTGKAVSILNTYIRKELNADPLMTEAGLTGIRSIHASCPEYRFVAEDFKNAAVQAAERSADPASFERNVGSYCELLDLIPELNLYPALIAFCRVIATQIDKKNTLRERRDCAMSEFDKLLKGSKIQQIAGPYWDKFENMVKQFQNDRESQFEAHLTERKNRIRELASFVTLDRTSDASFSEVGTIVRDNMELRSYASQELYESLKKLIGQQYFRNLGDISAAKLRITQIANQTNMLGYDTEGLLEEIEHIRKTGLIEGQLSLDQAFHALARNSTAKGSVANSLEQESVELALIGKEQFLSDMHILEKMIGELCGMTRDNICFTVIETEKMVGLSGSAMRQEDKHNVQIPFVSLQFLRKLIENPSMRDSAENLIIDPNILMKMLKNGFFLQEAWPTLLKLYRQNTERYNEKSYYTEFIDSRDMAEYMMDQYLEKKLVPDVEICKSVINALKDNDDYQRFVIKREALFFAIRTNQLDDTTANILLYAFNSVGAKEKYPLPNANDFIRMGASVVIALAVSVLNVWLTNFEMPKIWLYAISGLPAIALPILLLWRNHDWKMSIITGIASATCVWLLALCLNFLPLA